MNNELKVKVIGHIAARVAIGMGVNPNKMTPKELFLFADMNLWKYEPGSSKLFGDALEKQSFDWFFNRTPAMVERVFCALYEEVC